MRKLIDIAEIPSSLPVSEAGNDVTASGAGVASGPLLPNWLGQQSLGIQGLAVVLGTLFLALSSYIEVPMLPVPLTMQTFAITMIGAFYGWRLGGLTIVAWLVEGAIGLPVLAGGGAGLHHFTGPTGGYLFAFPVAGIVMGALVARGWHGGRPVRAFVAALLSNLACLALGAAWLGALIGMGAGIEHGLTPFLIGAVLKSALAAAVLAVIWHRTSR